MKSLSYDPKKLEIHTGDSVLWTNKARTTHTVTSDDDGKTFDSGDDRDVANVLEAVLRQGLRAWPKASLDGPRFLFRA